MYHQPVIVERRGGCNICRLITWLIILIVVGVLILNFFAIIKFYSNDAEYNSEGTIEGTSIDFSGGAMYNWPWGTKHWLEVDEQKVYKVFVWFSDETYMIQTDIPKKTVRAIKKQSTKFQKEKYNTLRKKVSEKDGMVAALKLDAFFKTNAVATQWGAFTDWAKSLLPAT